MAEPKRKRVFAYTLVALQVCLKLAVVLAGSRVEFLPGFDGQLPFELQTGYIGVDESDDVQLFYYFIKSQSNPATDPLMLWITGGPGCSSISAIIDEIGPFHFEAVEYNGSLPRIILKPYSWTEVASIIFLDWPVGTGFSYARTPKALESTCVQASDQAYQFLRKFLVDHPEFLSNPFYVGGGSYSGIPVPIMAQIISNGNKNRNEPFIDLKGYILGNPRATPSDHNSRVQFAHAMALISDELYQSLNRNCKGIFTTIDPTNFPCSNDMETFNQVSNCYLFRVFNLFSQLIIHYREDNVNYGPLQLVSNIKFSFILENNCDLRAPKPQNTVTERRELHETSQELSRNDLLHAFKCREEAHQLLEIWANDQSVQEALHIRKGRVGYWHRCNDDVLFIKTVNNSIPYHLYLSSKGYRSLITSGDHDMVVPHFETQDWIRSLNYSIIDEWRPWSVGGQVAGYTRTYANQMTFATIKGAGHTGAEYKPAECRAMFERWISYEPL